MDLQRYLKATMDQDAASMRSFFQDDAVICWHNTNERFTLEEYILANCEYPSQWQGEFERIENLGDRIITAAHVFTKDGSLSFHVTSFLELQGDQIIRLDEYWGDDGPAPQWRQDLNIGTPIR